MLELLAEIKACQICLPDLQDGVNPVVSFHKDSKVAVIGQAPGSIVHRTGKPWDDKSGERLRQWLDVDDESFYDPKIFAIVPMGFCYPGKGKSGDLPPRKECAPEWHTKIFSKLKKLDLVLLIGGYAQSYYLGDRCKRTLTETVRSFEEYLPEYLPLPHPSPRNNIWLKKNDWFEKDVIPLLQMQIKNFV